MKYSFGEIQDSGARATKIRTLFHGGTIAAHAEVCIDRGVWTETELRGKALRACKEEIRTALSAEVDGLPWAGETEFKEEGQPVWRQIDLWEYETFAFNITRRMSQASADIEAINRMVNRCLERFGRAPQRVALAYATEGND